MNAILKPATNTLSDTVLRIGNVSVEYTTRKGAVTAVRDVSLEIRRGETFGVVGESGSGKSTLAFAVVGYLSSNGRVTAGRIEYQGHDLLGMSRRDLDRLRGAKIAMVYQDPMSSLNPSIQAGEQVAEVLRVHDAMSSKTAWARTLELFEAVNMPEPEAIAHRYPHQISGGQQQRVLIAMALACNPDLLIMDEPTTGLDVTTEAHILDLIDALKKRFSSAILYISHNLGVIARISDRVGVMYAGQIVEQGSVREVFKQQLHPYTAGLLECIPSPDFGRKDRSLSVIRGIIPDISQLPDGCVFEPRCPYARERCRQEQPHLVEVTRGHHSRCFYWQEQEQTRQADLRKRQSAQPATPIEATTGTAEPLLAVNQLVKEYVSSNKLLGVFGTKTVVHAVDDISLSVSPNETLAVVGESGCGKTTVARCVVGLIDPTKGTVRFRGKDVTGSVASRDRDMRRRLQMVFQNPDSTLNPRCFIADALIRPLELFRGLKGRAAREAASELLQSVRLDDRYLDRLPNQLSGGEKQRVAIARAFATDPDLVVCDEPVSALDVSVQAAILNLLADLQTKHATAYMFISHDLSVVRYLADRVAVVYLGKICEVGPVDQVFAPPYHPYTEALLSAVPRLDPDAEVSRIRLEGPVPSAANPPSGCAFHTRCPRKVGPVCEQKAPPGQVGAEEHTVFCHIPLAQLSTLQSGNACTRPPGIG